MRKFLAKISVFVICVEEIIYLLLYNLHDCTFNKAYLGRTLFNFLITPIPLLAFAIFFL